MGATIGAEDKKLLCVNDERDYRPLLTSLVGRAITEIWLEYNDPSQDLMIIPIG